MPMHLQLHRIIISERRESSMGRKVLEKQMQRIHCFTLIFHFGKPIYYP